MNRSESDNWCQTLPDLAIYRELPVTRPHTPDHQRIAITT